MAVRTGAVCATLLLLCPHVAGESDPTRSPAEDAFTAAEAKEALAGFVWGMETSETEEQRSLCLGAVETISEPLTVFMANVVTACSTSISMCVPEISHSTEFLGNSSHKVLADVKTRCPEQFHSLLTAAQDQFLVVNMATLAILHATELAQEIDPMLQALAQKNHRMVGFFLARVIMLVLPLVRLPLTHAQMHEVVKGFVLVFTSEQEEDYIWNDLTSVDPSATQQNVSLEHVEMAGGHVQTHDTCLQQVRTRLDPANAALELIAGSLLNITCYQEISRLHVFACVERGFSGIAEFAALLHNMYRMQKRVQRAHCPKRFVEALRRLEDKPHLAVDLLTNSFTEFGLLQAHTRSAMEAFYADKLRLFGAHLGLLYDKATRHSFYKYRKLEFDFAGLSVGSRLLLLVLMAPSLLLLAALPLICLFCSAVSGWPSREVEVSVTAAQRDCQIELSHEFFGGQGAIGSEIGVDVVAASGSHYQSRPEAQISFAESMSSERSESDSLIRTRTEPLIQKTGAIGVGIARRATDRFLFRLTDEPPHDQGLAFNVLCSIVGFCLPCLYGGRRRWELQRFRRGGEVGGWERVTAVSSSEMTPELIQSLPPGSKLHIDDYTGVECRTYVNYDAVAPPVFDSTKPTAFTLQGVVAATVLLKPEFAHKECWDLLLAVSTCVQLLDSVWHMFFLSILGANDLVLNGEILTFWWHWSRLITAALVIHKKLHARWFTEVHYQHAQRPLGNDRWCGCFCRVRRTPTPVHLFRRAPAIKTASRPPIPFCYEHSQQARAGDAIRVESATHERWGQTGILMTSLPAAGGLYQISFGDVEQGLRRRDFDLLDVNDHARREGVWRDVLTMRLLYWTVGMWSVGILASVVLGPTLADEDGYLVLHLQAPSWREPLSDWVFTRAAMLQILCVVVEFLGTFVAFVLDRCLFTLFYA